MTPHIIETIVITLVLVFLVVLISLIVRDGFNFYKKYKNKKLSCNLSFSDYETIKIYPETYKYYAPYGISHSLILFISEIPSFINAIDTALQKNHYLIDDYHHETDKDKINRYINIGIQISNIIANTGKILVNRCRFYCINISNTFELECDASLVKQYCDMADELYYQFERIKQEKIDTPEIENTIDHMYRDFFDYFELINSLIKIIPNEKGELHNDK